MQNWNSSMFETLIYFDFPTFKINGYSLLNSKVLIFFTCYTTIKTNI